MLPYENYEKKKKISRNGHSMKRPKDASRMSLGTKNWRNNISQTDLIQLCGGKGHLSVRGREWRSGRGWFADAMKIKS